MSAKRKVLKGVQISPGIVLGYAKIILPGAIQVAEMTVPSSRVGNETIALEKAVEQTVAELRDLKTSAVRKIGGPVAKIFDAQLLIASDFEFLNKVKERIVKDRRNAGFAYNQLVQQAITPLKLSPDEYIRQMSSDIEAVAQRVLSHLVGYGRRDFKLAPNTILVGKSFTPGDILSYRQCKAVGFLVTEAGSNSHMALIARGLMLPIIQAKDATTAVSARSRLILDGTSATAIINPSDEEWSKYQKLKRRHGPAIITRIKRLTTIPPLTADGAEVQVAANLTLPGPADDILAEKNIPVGLYRTEFMFLAQNDFPDEEAQFECYHEIAMKFSGSTVVLRTFDLGYDKLVPDSHFYDEENPALGWRGIRVMLDMTQIFKTQIKAILRASTGRNLRILLPMISDVSELDRAKRIISQVKFSMRRDGVDFDPEIPVGIMIEVPSAALTADRLAAKSDFFSIGTNDLTQYTLAADRGNSRVAELYSPYHPSVLGLIEKTIRAGKDNGIPVAICGEMAGDILALPMFIGMGVGQLSMNPSRIFDLCRMVKRIDTRLAIPLARSVLTSDTKQAVLKQLQDYREAFERRQTVTVRK